MKALWLCIASLFATSAQAADDFEIAITVDDLPIHGSLPQGMTRLGIAQSHIETFKAHGVPEVFGFVNASRIKQEPGMEAVLDAWRAAGYPLGNHTASHLNLDRAATFAAWQADVEAGEPAVAERMQGANWRYMRFPNLAAGAEQARHDEAAAYLKAKGYKIAHVSVAFSDWVYTDAYTRCLAKGDTAAIETMKAQYLSGIDTAIARMKFSSERVYGRVIPQVLLTHVGGWSAVMLPQVLAKLDAAGAHYVTLAQAQSDPAYAASEQYLGGGSVIDRTATNKKVDLSGMPKASAGIDVKALCT